MLEFVPGECDARFSHNIACVHTLCHQLLRQPMMWMPRALSAIPDASSALQRLSHIFHAELMQGAVPAIDVTQEHAIVVRDATFEWESSGMMDEVIPNDIASRDERRGRRIAQEGSRETKRDNDTSSVPEEKTVFRVTDVTLTVPRGQLTAIVGPVGSGKVCLPLHFLFGRQCMILGPTHSPVFCRVSSVR